MERTLESGYHALRDFTLEIVKNDRDKKYAIRLLVFDIDKREKIYDRTFYAQSEMMLASKFMLYFMKQKVKGGLKEGKHKIRIMDTTTHQIPFNFLAQLQDKTDGKIFLSSEDKVSEIWDQ